MKRPASGAVKVFLHLNPRLSPWATFDAPALPAWIVSSPEELLYHYKYLFAIICGDSRVVGQFMGKLFDFDADLDFDNY